MLLLVHVIMVLHLQWTTIFLQTAVYRQVHKEQDPSAEQCLAHKHVAQVFIIKPLLENMHVSHTTLQTQQAQIILHATPLEIAMRDITQTDQEMLVMHNKLTPPILKDIINYD